MGQALRVKAAEIGESGADVNSPEKEFINQLEQAAIEYGKNAFSKNPEADMKKLDKCKVKVDFEYVTVKDHQSWPDIDEQCPVSTSAEKEREKKGEIDASKNILYKTEVKNDAPSDLVHNIKVKRTTKSTMETKVQTVVALGAGFLVKFGMPLALQGKVELKTNLSLTAADRTVVDNEMAWDVESNLTIPGMHSATVNVYVMEKKRKSKFIFTTTFEGDVIISFSYYDKECVFSTNPSIGLIVDYFENQMSDHDKQRLHLTRSALEYKRNKSIVTVTSKGESNFRYGTKQTVDVKVKKLEGSDSSEVQKSVSNQD